MSSSEFMSRAIRASAPINRLPTPTQERLIPLVEEDLSSDLLQDFLAIIHFPRQQNELPDRHLIIDKHLEQWGQKRFVNSFTTEDEDIVEHLVTIWLRVVDLVEDYLGKAVSKYPPRAYHNLPESYLEGSDAHAFNIKGLTTPERTRIIRAFLRHELICKVYHPRHRGLPRTYESERPDILNGQGEWTILSLYGPQQWTHWDFEELVCVHKYFCSLYGAVFARESSAWLPRQPTTNVPRRRGSGLVFPDSILFSPAAYAQDLGLHPNTWGCTASMLASYGLDLAIHLLADARLGRINGPWLRKLSRYINSASQIRCLKWGSNWPYESSFRGSGWETQNGWHDFLRGRLFQFSLNVEYFVRIPEAIFHQVNVYRQRAWVFFDDCCFYPMPWEEHFPKLKEVHLMGREAASGYLSLNQERILRRSRAWNEEAATYKDILWGIPVAEDEEDEEGTVALHPTEFLQPWLRPFWE